MTELIKININNEGIATVSSRVIAEHFEKQHKHIIRDIDEIKTSVQNWANLFTESTYPDSYGREQKEYLLTRDGFSLLAMGFTGKEALTWKLKFIEAFNKMEAALNFPYDLLVDDCVKVDVKVSNLFTGRTGNFYSCNLEKPYFTCDIYLVYLLENNKVKDVLVIPGKTVATNTQISIGEKNSKYYAYRDRWDLFEKFLEFYKKVS